MSDKLGSSAVLGFGIKNRMMEYCNGLFKESIKNIQKHESKSCADKKNRRIQSVTELGIAATKSAIASSRVSAEDLHNAGLILGIHHGRAEFTKRAEKQAQALGFKNYCDPISFVNSITSAVTGQIAIDSSIGGFTLTINTGDLSGLDAIGIAYLLNQSGCSKIFFAGGADSMEAINLSFSANIKKDVEYFNVESGAAILAISSIQNALSDKTNISVNIENFKSRAFDENGNIYDSLNMLIEEVLNERKYAIENVDIIISNKSNSFFSSLLKKYCYSNNVEYIPIEILFGYTGAASGALAAAYAVNAIRKEECIKVRNKLRIITSVLVLGYDDNLCCSCLLFKRNN